MVKRNMGPVDRLTRVVVGSVLIAAGFLFGTATVPGIVAFVVAGIALVTAAVGVCVAYIPFGISTDGGISVHGRRVGGGSRVVARR